MLTVKLLKPYYIKADDECIRVILASQYFSVLIHNQLYHFIPNEAKEIRINRRTHRVDNIHANFAFQKEKSIIHIPMSKLLSLPDFRTELEKIAEPYYIRHRESNFVPRNENAAIIKELERQNLQRLIDKALDERNRELFYALVQKEL